MLFSVVRNPQKLLNFSRKLRLAHQVYGKPYGPMLSRFFYLTLRESYTPREVFLWDLLGPKFRDDELRTCMSKKACVDVQLRLNQPTAHVLTEDKSVFYPYCQAHNLPTPKLHAVIGPVFGWTSDGSILRKDEEWTSFLSGLAARDVVIKPSKGVYARGVRLLRRQGDSWLDSKGNSMHAADVVAGLRRDAEYDSFIVQDRVFNHPELRDLSRSDYLQTLRLVTLVTGKDQVEILFCILRLIAKDATTDNFQQGASGNLLGDVCMERGQLTGGYALRPCGIGLDEITRHPGTEVNLVGFSIPYWQETCDLARRAAKSFLPLTTIGWDIAITERGPVLIEGNVTWSPIHNVQKVMHIFRDRAAAMLG